MGSPSANPKILYRNSRLLRMVFLQLHRQQRADLFCDVVLQAEGQAVPAHCCILSACSPFFTERLEREMPPKGRKLVLELRGLKIGPLRKLVDFLYTSEMEVSREEAQDVLAAAQQLQVSELESLQLEGGKLVKKALGRRLNRECLQLSSPLSIPEGSLMLSAPASGGCLTSRPLARKQHSVVKLPCTKGAGNSSSTSQKGTVKEKPAIKSENKQQMSADLSTVAVFRTTKTKKRLVGTGRNTLDNEETGHLHTEQARPRDEQAVAGLQELKKIKLSRPKPSSLPLPYTTEDHSASNSSRRLWRKKSPAVKTDAKEAKLVSHLHGILSLPLPPKATKSRKRSSSEPAPSLHPPQEAGQVGRMMLRKVTNGSCWEVVQKPSASQPMRAAGSVCALAEEGSLPQPGYPKQEVTATQQEVGSTRLLPAKVESSPLTDRTLIGEAGNAVTLADRDCFGGDSYQLLMLDQLAEGEQYDSLAAAGELEHMLDLLLVDDDAVGESQGTAVPEGVPPSGPAAKASYTPLENAGTEEEHQSPAEVADSPQWTKAEKNTLQGQEGCPASTISEGTHGLTNGVPCLDSVNVCLSLATPQSSSDCIPLCNLSSPSQESSTAHREMPVLENGATSLTAPLPSPKNQGLPSSGDTTSGVETKPQTQALPRSPLQQHLVCKLPPKLAIAEEDEIDVGGIEELFLYSEGIRPNSSPVFEYEVDVVN